MVVQGVIWTSFVSLSFNWGAKSVAHGAEQLVGASALEIRPIAHAVMQHSSRAGDGAASAGL
jgi:hypothetical protein